MRPLALGGFSVLENLQFYVISAIGVRAIETTDYLDHMNAKRRARGLEI